MTSCAHEDDYRIILFDYETGLTGDQMRELRSIGVRTVQTFLRWPEAEPESGVYVWDTYDRYVDQIRDSGMRLLIRLPWASPVWAPQEWFFRSRLACSVEGRPLNRFFSIWNADAFMYTEEFIRRACERYSGGNVVCCSCIGFEGEMWFPFKMGGDYDTKWNGSLWCFDPYAVADFRECMEAEYGTVSAFNSANGTNFESWEDVIPGDLSDSTLRWADTVEWYNWSAEVYHRRILDVFLEATGKPELWIATVPRHGFTKEHLEAGQFQAEEWIERMRVHFAGRGAQLNQLWYSVFLTDVYTMAFHYWILRHYPEWAVWVGAETAVNIVHTSATARTIGCKGVIVGNPYGGCYAGFHLPDALSNIEKASRIWRAGN